MGYNGSGTFELTDGVRTQPGVCVAQQSASTGIDPSLLDYMLEDVTSGLSSCITKDGQTTITANIPFNNKLITGLGDAVNLSDAANAQFVQDGSSTWLGSTSGSASTYTATASPTISGYVTGQKFLFHANHSNTGAATLNIDGKGAKDINKGDGTEALIAADIVWGVVYEVCYDGTRFVILGGSADIVGTANEIEVTKTGTGIALGLTDDVTIPNDLTVTNDLTVSNDFELTGNIISDLLRSGAAFNFGTESNHKIYAKVNDTATWEWDTDGSYHPTGANRKLGANASNEAIDQIVFDSDSSAILCRSYTNTWYWRTGYTELRYIDPSAATALDCANMLNTLIEEMGTFGNISASGFTP